VGTHWLVGFGIILILLAVGLLFQKRAREVLAAKG